MVVMRSGEELTFVAPPRNDPDAAFKYRVQMGSEKADCHAESRARPAWLW